LLWIEDKLQAADMAAYILVKQKQKNSPELTPEDTAVVDKVEKYILSCCSTWLEHGGGSNDSAVGSDPAYNPQRNQFDKSHPCSNYIDVEIDYSEIKPAPSDIDTTEKTTSAASKRPRYGEPATKAARDLHLAVDMHRCCPTCHK
jgi:hypothetical protein